jgi:hypothetical protein
MGRKGTQGFDLLDAGDRVAVDPDVKEKSEPLNLRTSDPLDLALGEILRRPVGGYISRKQYSVDVPGSSYPVDFAFDRWYWAHKLLVDFINQPLSEPEKEAVAAEIKQKKDIAARNGQTYFPIVGQTTPGELKAALGV